MPEKVVLNEQLTQFPEGSRPLIATKTGVLSRRVAPEHSCTSDLAIEAGLACLKRANFPPEKVQGVLLSTSSPDCVQPPTAARAQAGLGVTNAFAFDMNSVCSGSTYGICMADALIRSGRFRKHIVHRRGNVLQDSKPQGLRHRSLFRRRGRGHTVRSGPKRQGRPSLLPGNRRRVERRSGGFRGRYPKPAQQASQSELHLSQDERAGHHGVRAAKRLGNHQEACRRNRYNPGRGRLLYLPPGQRKYPKTACARSWTSPSRSFS